MGTDLLFLDFKLDGFEFFDHLAQSLHLDILRDIVLHTPVGMCPLTHAVCKEEGEVISGDI